MSTIIDAVASLIECVFNMIVGPNGFMTLLIKPTFSGTFPNMHITYNITWVGVFVIVVPLVSLGIGIIVRLVKKS